MLTKPFLRTSVAELRTLHAINVESIWIGTQTAYPLLEAAARASGGASVVNISSVFGQVAAVAQSAYSATKGAITVLTKSVAGVRPHRQQRPRQFGASRSGQYPVAGQWPEGTAAGRSDRLC
ncbi:SDR family NAD(P)-dependent oxidoreductase [Achromobacter xylosoxidans]